MRSRFKTQDEFLASLSSSLDESGVGADVRTAVLSGIASADDSLRGEAPGRRSAALDLRVASWVVSSDDLPIIRALSSTATAIMATVATGGAAAPAVVTALSSLAELCWRAWRKGARLSASQVLVLGLLEAKGPLELDRLVALVGEQGEDRSTTEMVGILRDLGEVELNDGRLIALVAEDDAGLWRAKKI